MLKKLIASCLCAGSLLHTTHLLAAEGQPIVIRFSHVAASDTPKGHAAELLQQLVSQRLAGKVKVEVYADSRLLSDAEELKALQDNRVQMLAPSMAKLSAMAPALLIYDLPFLFGDQEDIDRFQRRPYGRALLASLEPQNITGLAYWHNGMKQLSATRALQKPADASGLSFRIQPSPVLEAQFRALGAQSHVLPFDQLAHALQSGAVQGQENTWSNIESQRIDHLQPYITESNHGVIDYMLITNSQFWYGIPQATRSELEGIIADVSYAMNEEARQINLASRQHIQQDGKAQILSLTPAERSAWRDAMRPVWHQFEQQIGKETLDAAERASRDD